MQSTLPLVVRNSKLGTCQKFKTLLIILQIWWVGSVDLPKAPIVRMHPLVLQLVAVRRRTISLLAIAEYSFTPAVGEATDGLVLPVPPSRRRLWCPPSKAPARFICTGNYVSRFLSQRDARSSVIFSWRLNRYWALNSPYITSSKTSSEKGYRKYLM